MLGTIAIILAVLSVVTISTSTGTQLDSFKLLSVLKDAQNQTVLINNVIDNAVLPSLKKYIDENNVEPIDLPGYERDFQVGIFNGWIKLDKGNICGLSSIIRSGDVIIKYNSPNLLLHIPLTVEVLHFKYLTAAKLLGFNINGELDGKAVKNSFTVDIEIDTVSLKALLRGFALGTPGDITITLTDDNIPAWVVRVFSTVVVPHLKPLASGVVGNILLEFVEGAIQLYNRSICATMGTC